MKQWCLIALDMDGTLLDKEGNISIENQTWIHKARNLGIEVTLATGRPRRLIESYLELLELRVPYVVANGSEVWDAQGQLLERHTIEHKDMAFLLELVKEFETTFWSSVVDHVFKPCEFPDHLESYQWLKFGLRSDDDQVIERIWKRLEGYGGLEVTSSDRKNIEVNPKGISKATGLQRVCELLKIHSHQVVTIGDGLNDMAMMKWSGLGIAMGNAPELVKATAVCITEDNIEHGVARAIEKLLKNEWPPPIG